MAGMNITTSKFPIIEGIEFSINIAPPQASIAANPLQIMIMPRTELIGLTTLSC